MPFENFMAMALYDPNFGYYTTSIDDIGGDRGDFATSATLSGALGRAIAKWLLEEKECYEWDNPIPVIEVGAGNGALADQVLRALGWWKRRQFRYHIVEVSRPLRKRQEHALRSQPVEWHDSMADALEVTGGRALIFSNELVDAFPAKWLCWSEIEQCWLEVFVQYHREKGLQELFRPLPKGFPEENYSALSLDRLDQGQRVEIQPLFQLWLGNLAEHLEEGSLLTIDYGGRPGEIYDRRPDGTVRAYYRQQRMEGGEIYQRFGKQDLTVDVNFEDISDWGEDFGLSSISEESQAAFLSRYGETGDAMAETEAGEAFRVLLQRKGGSRD